MKRQVKLLKTLAVLAMVTALAVCAGAAPGARAPLDVLDPTPIPSEPLAPAEPPETLPETESPPSGEPTQPEAPPAPGTEPLPPEAGSGPGSGSGPTPPNEGEPGPVPTAPRASRLNSTRPPE